LSGGPSLAGASPAAGLSARTLVEAGRLVVINEALNACDAGYLVQGSSADQHAGMQSFLNAIGNAIGGNGGRGFIPPEVVAAPHTVYAISVGASGRPQGLKN
jgi:hypothetical protein